MPAVVLAAAYGMYAVFGIISILFAIKMVSETKGKELEDMDQLWVDVNKVKAEAKVKKTGKEVHFPWFWKINSTIID